MRFKSEFSYVSRQQESNRIRTKYPQRIPIICEKLNNSTKNELDKKKYLVANDLTCGQFLYIIRKRMELPPEKALFLFIKGIIPPIHTTLFELDTCYRDEDGFLYLSYSEENVFGEEEILFIISEYSSKNASKLECDNLK
jgi:GABA(A) receptor-associated protein